MLGDFSFKVGQIIEGNGEEATKSGKLLRNMIKENNMVLLNGKEYCKGKWTRVKGEKKSIIDYDGKWSKWWNV